MTPLRVAIGMARAWIAFSVAIVVLFSGPASAKPTFETVKARSGYFRTSDGVRLHYLEAGKGPAIVFVPGWTVPAWMWDPQIRYFMKDHHVIALDPRSQGRSGRSDEGNNPETHARDIKELVEERDLGRVVLVGHSLAVRELLSYVDQFGTSSVTGLVLVDHELGPLPKPEQTAQFFALLRQTSLNRRELLKQMAASFYKKPTPPGYMDALLEDAMRVPTNTALALIASSMGTDYRPVLTKITVPVLYAITPEYKEEGEWLTRNVPSAKVEVFENAGHVLFMDEAERFNKLLERFARGAFEQRHTPAK